MDFLVTALLTAITLFGHGALWVTFINRWNSFALGHRLLRWVNRGSLVACALISVGLAGWIITNQFGQGPLDHNHGGLPPSQIFVTLYILACWMMAAWASLTWLARRAFDDHIPTAGESTTAFQGRRRPALPNSSTAVRGRPTMTLVREELIDIAKLSGEDLAGSAKTRICACVSANQIFQLQLRTLELHLPYLPPALDGFSIVHLSDLHMAGHVRRPFYDEVVRRANDFAADVAVITGDILDRADCLPWLAPTLGELTSRHGTYFILGNHDHRGCPPAEVRRTLTDAGLIDVGGGFHSFDVNEAHVTLVGNEAPWEKSPIDVDDFPQTLNDPNTLSIALSHAPDQLDWASKNGFDLMLAGHTHGGQIRLPVIGPLLAPSCYGVKYACGTFVRQSTVIHVTRGICAMTPMRLNCPPELTKLILRKIDNESATDRHG